MYFIGKYIQNRRYFDLIPQLQALNIFINNKRLDKYKIFIRYKNFKKKYSDTKNIVKKQ